MPVFSLQTNVPQSKITEGFLKELSSTIAKLLSKPESYVTVHVQGGQALTFAGTSEPAGFAVLKSIGGVGGTKNNAHSSKLFPLIEKELGISGQRLYIEYIDLGASDIAYNGHTFA